MKKQPSTYQQLVSAEAYGRFVATIEDAFKKALDFPDSEVRVTCRWGAEFAEAKRILHRLHNNNRVSHPCVRESVSTDDSVELYNGSVVKLFITCKEKNK